MRKPIVALLVLALLAITPMASLADVPAPGGPFSTAFRVQNLGSAAASCVLDFYTAAGGTSAATISLPSTAVGDSAYVYVPSLTQLAAGQYSGVVSCDQPVAAVVNFSDAMSGTAYRGFNANAISQTLYAPAMYNNYYSYFTNVIAQNTTASPVDVTVAVYAPGNPTPVLSETKTAPANGYVTFEQEGKTQLAANVSYSAKITATGPVAALVNIYGRGAVATQLYSYDAFASGSTTAYAPVIMNQYYGYNTALVIQNMGTATANVTITYGNGTVKTTQIGPGASNSRYTPAEGIPTRLLTGAVIQSTNGQPLAVLVNESTTGTNRASSYEGFSQGTTTVRAPIVMKDYYRYNTSVTCQNVGTAPATMTVAYSGISSSLSSPSIQPNGTHLFLQQNDSLLSGVPKNWISSATVTSAQPIVCVVNEDMNMAPEASQVKDMLYSYDGIGQ